MFLGLGEFVLDVSVEVFFFLFEDVEMVFVFGFCKWLVLEFFMEDLVVLFGFVLCLVFKE